MISSMPAGEVIVATDGVACTADRGVSEVNASANFDAAAIFVDDGSGGDHEPSSIPSRWQSIKHRLRLVSRNLLDGGESLISRTCRDGATCRGFRIEDRLDAIEIVAPNADPGRVTLWFHGGAFQLFSVWTHREMLGRISKATGTRIVAVNYRLAPMHPFPAAFEDALAGWRWVREHCTTPSGAAAAVAVGGDSAGGNLAFALLVKLAQLGEEMPVACVCMAPWLLLDNDLIAERRRCEAAARKGESQRSASMKERMNEKFKNAWDSGARKAARAYLKNHSPQDPVVSPLLVDEALLKRFPPVLIHADEDEPLADDAREMVSRCTQAGVTTELKLYNGTYHVF